MSRLCHLLAFAGVLLLLVWLSQSYSQHEAELVPVRVVRHVRNFDTAPPVAAADASSPPSAAAFSERRTRRRGGVADERLRSSSSIAVVEPGSSTGAASRDDERLAALRCGGLSLPVKACRVWYASRDVLTAPTSPHVLGGRRRACVSACHNRGVCDEQTGVCACEAGYNGSACENLNLRGCNGRTDGLWHASHCAGECDERRGYCFCPGQINGRPMSDTCQVQHMPVDAFAALVLKPDPAWIRFAANGSKLDRGVGKGSGLDRKTELARRDLFDRDLAARTRAFQLEPRRRAQALERFWFGEPSGAGASRWRVVLSEYGVPHAYRGTSGANAVSAASGSAATAAEAASVASAAVLTPPTRRRRQRGRRLRGPSAQELEREAALPAAAALAAGEPTRRHGEHLYQKLAARQTYAMADVLRSAPRPEAHTLPQTPKAAPIRAAWCDATPNDLPRRVAKSCACTYDGLHGPLCDERHEPFCLNQCSGHGVCDATGGGFCHCDAGFFGIDCSMTTREDGRVTLHAEHVAHRRPRSPSVFVYELWDHTSLILQYRGYAGYCVHRTFNERNGTAFNDNYAYTIETALHEWLLRSPHRTVDGASADYFYVPSYLACTILPVYDWVGPGPFATGFPMRPVTAMRMAYDALQQIRQRWPYYNESIRSRRTNHVWLFPHDEGGCWAPLELYQHSILLTHWGRMDATPTSSSRYVPDNWEAKWTIDERAPAGQVWSFPPSWKGGSRSMIGTHPCYDPRKDLVIPVFAPAPKWEATPWLKGGADKAWHVLAARHGAARGLPPAGADAEAATTPAPWERARPTLAYFSGNLAHNEPLKYARGIRHRLWKSFGATPGWRLVGKAGGRYSQDLASSDFCIVPPGGDGWSSRVDDSVRHGCIPVIIMDNVQMPFESVLNYSAFAIRVAEKDVELVDSLLRSVRLETRRAMREAMFRIWTRFVYARSFLDADGFLPHHAASGRELPTGFLQEPALAKLRTVVDHGAPDAFDTIMMALDARLRG